MDKVKLLQPLKGFRDFLPEDLKKRKYALRIIQDTFELYGFEPLETPALEYKEVLFGHYGTEADKLVYSFQDVGGREVALKYDQTVPTARVLATYRDKITLPFRRYQIQPVWRAEKPQSGRYREFLQCDADIYGSISLLADAEILALSSSIFKNLGFTNFTIYINDRKILFGLMKYASIPENLQLATISAIDKLDRKTKEEVREELLTIGVTDISIEHLFHHLDEAQSTDNIKKIIKHSQNLGVDRKNIVFQARLARGLTYYTSTIFEIKIKEYDEGSVLGGGRYDNLIKDLSGIDIPAVGFGLGFDRTVAAMDKLNLFTFLTKRTGALVTIFSKELIEISNLVTADLRNNNIAAELFIDESKDLKKQLKYADKKGIRWLIVIGPEEIEKEKVILKDLETGHQEEVKLKTLAEKIKNLSKATKH